jgi:hypothetical protein
MADATACESRAGQAIRVRRAMAVGCSRQYRHALAFQRAGKMLLASRVETLPVAGSFGSHQALGWFGSGCATGGGTGNGMVANGNWEDSPAQHDDVDYQREVGGGLSGSGERPEVVRKM